MATDKKVTQLDSLTTLSGDDLFMVVDDPSGTPVNKKVSASSMFGDIKMPLNVSGNTMSISANATVTGNMSLSANTTVTGANAIVAGVVTISANTTVTGELRLTDSTPSSSNTVTEGIGSGKIWFDQSYIYVAVSNTVIKRVALSDF